MKADVAMSTGRFALLEHGRDGASHRDFLLERDGASATWAIASPIASGRDLRAERLADHRNLYLDYEGPIPGGRGEVRRLARGTYTTREWSEDRVAVTLVGDQLMGEVVLSRDAGAGGWVFRLEGKFD